MNPAARGGIRADTRTGTFFLVAAGWDREGIATESSLEVQESPARAPTKAKLNLVGAPAVGKTSLIRRFVTEQFEGKYVSTLGVKVSTKRVTLAVPGRDEPVSYDMTIWDIMGARGFRDILQEAYFYGARGVLAVCDATRRETLAELDTWLAAVFKVTGPIPVRVLANKADLEAERAVAEEDLCALAKRYDAPCSFTSARTGLNVEEAFEGLGVEIARKWVAKR